MSDKPAIQAIIGELLDVMAKLGRVVDALARAGADVPVSAPEPPATVGGGMVDKIAPPRPRYTSAQIDYLKDAVARGVNYRSIAEDLCAMADRDGTGARPSPAALSIKMTQMRKAGELPPAKGAVKQPRPAVVSTLQVKQPPPAVAAVPQEVKHPQYQKPAAEPASLKPARPRLVTKSWALQWARQRGLCADGVLDMDAVNAKAIALGIAGGFTLVPAAAMGRSA